MSTTLNIDHRWSRGGTVEDPERPAQPVLKELTAWGIRDGSRRQNHARSLLYGNFESLSNHRERKKAGERAPILLLLLKMTPVIVSCVWAS